MGNCCHAQDLYRHGYTGLRSAHVVPYHVDEQAGGPDPSGPRPHISKEQTVNVRDGWNVRFIMRRQSGLFSDQGSWVSLCDRRDGWRGGWEDSIDGGHRILRSLLLFKWDPTWLLIVHYHKFQSSEHLRQHGWTNVQG